MNNGQPHVKASSKIDMLFLNPSINYLEDQRKIAERRIEGKIGNQESPHLGIGYLMAAAKRVGLKVKYIDMPTYGISTDQILSYIEECRPRMIGLTAYTVQINAAGYIAQAIKERFPDVLAGVGGPHVTIMPRESLDRFEAFDFVVCGEGETILAEVFKRLKEGRSFFDIKGLVTRGKTNVSYEINQCLDDLPFPAWEDFDLKNYFGIFPHCTKLELPMSTSRGCPFSCIFCVRPFGRKRRHRSITSVINEIKRNINDFGCESICFIDETFIFDLEWSEELFHTMIAEGIHKKIKWSCETRVDTVSLELFKLMRSAGCYYVFFGLESGNDTILKNIKKNVTTSDIHRAVMCAKDAGLVVAGSFIIGLPGETRQTVKRTVEFAKALNIYSTTFPIAVPFPGTALREMAIKSQYGLKILTDNWDDYGKQYPGVMENHVLSREALRELQKFAYDSIPKKKLPTT